MTKKIRIRLALVILSVAVSACDMAKRGTGDLGLVIERAKGSLQIIETTGDSSIARIEGLGDLSHASVVYSRDERFAYVFGRDGGLSKIDLLNRKIEKRLLQSGNSIGGAISQDGKLVAVSNYKPGGVKIFDADTLTLVADIPAVSDESAVRSKVVGLVDIPGQGFAFSLFDANEIWLVYMGDPQKPIIKKFQNIGRQPYDALISPDGRYYIAGLFNDDGLALLDLWNPDRGVRRILSGYGRGDKKLPVYKMPHLEGWAMADDYVFVPAVGHHEVLVFSKQNWRLVKRLPMHGQPVFVIARPDGRQVWVNFAHPDNDTVQVIDVRSLKLVNTIPVGKAVLHMEFTPRGEKVWISVRDEDRVDIYHTDTHKRIGSIPADKPSGIFFTSRAHKIGL